MTVSERAYAKINLFLNVTGRREDGFHDIISVMHSLDLCDVISLSLEESDKTRITITTNQQGLPTDESNIVYRAAAEYLSRFNITAKVDIHIEKSIPIGAGLGGGSSDAAATLRALNRIFNKADRITLHQLASDLGSDVPFCLVGGLSLCEGRGEKITSLKPRKKESFVIAIGESRVSTPIAYKKLDMLYNNFAVEPTERPVDFSRKITSELTYSDINILSYNIFEGVIKLKEIDKIKEIMTKNGAEYTLMSGSGPSVFGKFSRASDADDACKALSDIGFTAFACSSVYPEVEI